MPADMPIEQAPATPFVAVLTRYRVRYRGRAEAKGSGAAVIVIAKSDGSLVVHDPASGVKPLYYNPPGHIRSWRRQERWHIRGTTSRGEILTISGLPAASVPAGLESAARARRVRRTERELSTWLASKPPGLDLPAGTPDPEALAGGGRVDLLFPDGTVVEVKKQATVAAYDQAQRYLRGGAPRVVIACLRASPSLMELCRTEGRIELLLLE